MFSGSIVAIMIEVRIWFRLILTEVKWRIISIERYANRSVLWSLL